MAELNNYSSPAARQTWMGCLGRARGARLAGVAAMRSRGGLAGYLW